MICLKPGAEQPYGRLGPLRFPMDGRALFDEITVGWMPVGRSAVDLIRSDGGTRFTVPPYVLRQSVPKRMR